MKVFELFVWAIISIGLILLGINLFMNLNEQEDPINLIKQNLLLAESPTHLGQLIHVDKILIPKNYLINKTAFDLDKRSVAIECTSEKDCCQKGEKCELIEWDNTYALFKQSKEINFFVRCYEDVISICRIYFGTIPAQTKIKNIELTEQQGNNYIFSILVNNSGKKILEDGKLSGQILKKLNNKWQLTETFSQPITISNLLPNQNHTFINQFYIKTPGEYKVEFNFSSTNAGFDKNSLDFNIGTNLTCITSPGEETFANEDLSKINEKRFCDGCNYGYECYSVWKDLMPDKNWEVMNKDSAYYTREKTNEEKYSQEECYKYSTENNLICNYGENCEDSYYTIKPENSFDLCCCREN